MTIRFLIKNSFLLMGLCNCSSAFDEEPQNRLTGSKDATATQNETENNGQGRNNQELGDKSKLNTNTNRTRNTEVDTQIQIKDINAGMLWLGAELPKIGSMTKAVKTSNLKYINSELKPASTSNGSVMPPEEFQIQIAGHRTDPKSYCKVLTQIYNKDQELAGALDYICNGSSQYGFKTCTKLKEEFIGQKTIGEFKGSFGVKLTCEVAAKSKDLISQASTDSRYEEYHTHEIWFHKDSNEPRRRVKQIVRSCYDLGKNDDFAKCKTNEKGDRTFTLYEYANLPPHLENIPETVPPPLFGSFTLAGSVLTPGTFYQRFSCYSESKLINPYSIFSGLDASYVTLSRSNPTDYTQVGTMATPSNPQSSAGFTILTFVNKDWWNKPLGNATFTITKHSHNYMSFKQNQAVSMWNPPNMNAAVLKASLAMPEVGYCFKSATKVEHDFAMHWMTLRDVEK